MAVMTLKETQTETMKARLSDILLAVSWSDLSRTYFGKSNSWLYHKLDGVDLRCFHLGTLNHLPLRNVIN